MSIIENVPLQVIFRRRRDNHPIKRSGYHAANATQGLPSQTTQTRPSPMPIVIFNPHGLKKPPHPLILKVSTLPIFVAGADDPNGLAWTAAAMLDWLVQSQ